VVLEVEGWWDGSRECVDGHRNRRGDWAGRGGVINEFRLISRLSPGTHRAAIDRTRSQVQDPPPWHRTLTFDRTGSLPAAVPAQVRQAGVDGAGRDAGGCSIRPEGL